MFSSKPKPVQQAQQGVQQPTALHAPAPSCCVFIGNIPYDTPIPHLSQTLSLIGPFSLFRLKLDRDTLAPKGFGFVEYRDQDLAASALRNLNRSEVMRRELKVDYASDGKNGVNLREVDVRERDTGEVIVEGGGCMEGGRHEGGREETLKALNRG